MLLFNILSGFISKSETCLSILINDIPVNLRFLESGSEAVNSVLRLTFTEEQGMQDPVEQSSVKVT